MKSIRNSSFAVAVGLLLLANTAWAQLYDDDKATTGELNNSDYWWAKFDDMMLQLAIKQHQPEGAIGMQLIGTNRRLDELTKKYPNHEEIKQMKKRAEEAAAKIGPDAPRDKHFSPECPWEEANFAQLWVNLHWAKAAFAAKDYDESHSSVNNVLSNYAILSQPDRMKNYPDDLRKYVMDSKAQADKLATDIQEKQHPGSTTGKGVRPEDVDNAASGDLNSQDYWWARYDDMMLSEAIKQHQPEGRIGLQLASMLNRLKDLSNKYPKHEEVARMRKRVEETQAKISPDASRDKPFSPECPWEEANFAQLWVNLHWAKAAYDAHDITTARSCMQNVMQNYEIMTQPDRMKNYPEDLRKWVLDNKAEADKLSAEIKDKAHH
jgi:hypothetical protein